MRRGAAVFEATLAMLVGLSAGVVESAILMARGVFVLQGTSGAAIHYSAACALAAVLVLPPRWRRAAQPLWGTFLPMLLLTFVVRRWGTVWLNLEPLDWRSGEAGEAVGVILPFEGWILGLVLGADTALRGRAGDSARDHP